MGTIHNLWKPVFSDSTESFSLSFSFDKDLDFSPNFGEDIRPVFGEGTTNYEDLQNKPSINGVILQGDKSNEELKIDSISNIELESILK